MGNCMKKEVNVHKLEQRPKMAPPAAPPLFPPVDMPMPSVDLQDYNLNHLRKTFNEDFNAFLLNNLLLTVQFFKNFDR